MPTSGLHNALQYYNTCEVTANAFFIIFLLLLRFDGVWVLGDESDIYGLIKLLFSFSCAQKPTD